MPTEFTALSRRATGPVPEARRTTAKRLLGGVLATLVLLPVGAAAAAPPAAAATVVYASDSFNRTVSGSWGTADVGGSWNASGAAYAVTPGSATIQADMTTPTNFLAASVSAQDVDVAAKVSPPPTSGAYVDFGVGARFQPAGGNFYQVSAFYASSNNGGNYTVELKRKPENVQIMPDFQTSVSGGSPVVLRLQAQGTNPTVLRWKIWATSSPEPATWTATGSDGTPALQAAGGVGVEAFANSGSASVAFNSFSATSFDPPAPAVTCTADALACDTFNRTTTGGWGTADVGGPWSSTGPAYAVTPGNASIAADSSAPTNYLTSVSVRDVDALAKITPPPISSTYVDTGVGVRSTASTGSFYQLSTYYATGNNNGDYTLELKSQPANALVIPEVQTAIPGGAPIWLRLQAKGANPTTLSAKIWADGTPEPTAWTANATDGTAGLQAAGGVAALKAYSNSGTSTVLFNGLLVTGIARVATTLVAHPATIQVLLLRIYFPNLSATLTAGSSATPLVGQPVTFTVGTSVVCTAKTDTKGTATCSGSLSSILGTILNLGYNASYAGNSSYLPSASHGALIGL